MKICIKCTLEKHPTDFSIKQAAKDGRNGKCKECDKTDKQEYRDNNKDKLRELSKKHRLKHREEINKRQRLAYQRVKEHRSSEGKEQRRLNPENELYKGAKYRAKRKDIPFDITPDDIRIPELCPVLGIPLSIGDGKLHEGSPTLDRFIPELGYVKGNINVISSLANTIKSNATWEQVQAVADWMQDMN